MRGQGLYLAAFVMCHLAAAEMSLAGPVLRVSTVDSSSHPVAGVAVQLLLAGQLLSTQPTDAQGQTTFSEVRTGLYTVQAVKEGYQPARRADLEVEANSAISLELTMIGILSHSDSVEVSANLESVQQGASAPATLTAQTTKDLPNRPATVADALPLIPGVVRDPGGSLSISASAEHRSAMVVNSTDVTDPATGQFGLTVPIDSVETINVYQTPFLAEYGRFTAGLISVETRRGGEKWNWELNDPLPEFFIRSWHLRGLKDATPRFNFEGPLIPGKLYISEGIDYDVRKTSVYELPFPYNQKKQEGVNSFAQLDWVISDKHLLTATAHVAPQRMDFVGLDYFNPEPTTPDARTHNYTGVLGDHLSLFGGLLDSNFSVTKFDASIWGAGADGLQLRPAGNTGSYFATQAREALRIGGTTTYSFAPWHHWGTHNFKLGADVAGSNEDGLVNKHPVELLGATGQLRERIAFTPGLPFEISDVGLSFFGQDHWQLNSRLSLDAGMRVESQEITDSFRFAPRVGVSWSPWAHAGTVINAGFGWFYDRVPLNVYAFASYPWEFITQYDANGGISAGPFLFKNTLGQVFRHHKLIFQGPEPGNFSPQSQIWTLQVEQPVSGKLKLRLGYTQNDANGLVTVVPEGPDLTTNTGGYLLSGAGGSRYRQLEATARFRLPGEGRQLFFSYVYSRARGDLNDFNNYLGSFPIPIIRANLFGNLPSSLPHRFLAWGVVQLPAKFRIAPIVEYRNGFPYSAVDELQNYAGVPNQYRYPHFFSVDSRISKDIQINPKYGIRLSLASFNLSNHFNPEAVHYNVADPAYGYFFGHRGRRFTVDFDILF
jgi:Carboxypeptidase regulatory-like domain